MVSNRYVIVVGCGRIGSLLANRLSSLGSSVVVIDREESAFQNLSTEFSGFRVTGDAAELAVLRQARIDKAECLLAITSHDNVNLMVAQVAQTVFSVPQVMARVN
ncbi:MAG: NAD(P)-binding domain-containing protein, partial [Anaerolineae bacterium]|nr:NAD(P)-binding domain-containing protein [Anaerolineae bacterium]